MSAVYSRDIVSKPVVLSGRTATITVTVEKSAADPKPFVSNIEIKFTKDQDDHNPYTAPPFAVSGQELSAEFLALEPLIRSASTLSDEHSNGQSRGVQPADDEARVRVFDGQVELAAEETIWTKYSFKLTYEDALTVVEQTNRLAEFALARPVPNLGESSGSGQAS